MKSVLSILLGIVIAWLILTFTSSKRSNYLVLQPTPVDEPPAQNSALIGAGLAVAKPSVMDATPADTARPVMMSNMQMAPISVSRPPMPPMNPQMAPSMNPQQRMPPMNQQMAPSMNPQMMPPMNPQMMPPMNQQMPPAMNPQQQIR